MRMEMAILTTVAQVKDARARLSGRVALVPTMGALHAGHRALVDKAQTLADHVIVSVFVNPAQFGPQEDFARYPRTLEADADLLRAAGVGFLYAPAVEDMYPEGSATTVHVGGHEQRLCGAFRPGHFNGVATVVAKLLLQTSPHVALFGEKDFQQLMVITRMVRDLEIPVDIVGVPTVREADGLALSSRNRYLSAADRRIAVQLYATLLRLRGLPAADVPAQGRELLLAAGFAKVDYVEVDAGRVLAAAWLGSTRLIDNVHV